ncbi:response regulator [Mariprofundus micogutta]|uniref:response regulator n=1 Tax=Mariprofundus micogutta TaxID=1921010 RepID=UPI001558D481|nr:response regulator transcription factor [Mariprofundus micogutta]
MDDNDEFRQGLVQVLQEDLQATHIIEARSVADARDLTGQHHRSFNLMLFDHGLPDGEGVVLLEEILNQYPYLKIVMLSGWEDPGLMRQALEVGALGYIPKSTKTSVMITAIQLVLAGGTYIPTHLLAYLSKEGSPAAKAFTRDSLTKRQLEVYDLLRADLSNKEIARRLNITEATVKAHVTAILRSQGVTSRTQLLP